MKPKCKHKWVDMEDGSLDQFCVRCRKFQMQAVLKPSSIDASAPLSMPLQREKIEVPFYTGSDHIRVEVYKDDLVKRFNKELGLTINLFNDAAR